MNKCPEEKSELMQTPKYVFFPLVRMKTCHGSKTARNLKLKYFFIVLLSLCLTALKESFTVAAGRVYRDMFQNPTV